MKLHYYKILLFSLPLNILEHNNNKPYITPHTSTTTSRVLSKCDLYTPKYDNDAEMKSVKDIFDRQTSRRFEEHEEHMKEKRRKYKEQCDNDIQKIIEKDKMEKTLAEKVEKGCLRCGCGLGGVAVGVGIFGSLGTYSWKVAATATAIEVAKEAGIKAGIDAVISAIKSKPAFVKLKHLSWSNYIDGSNYSNVNGLFNAVTKVINSTGATCASRTETIDRACSALSADSNYWFRSVITAGQQATDSITATAQKTELVKVTTTSSNAYSAIGYSVTAILIVVLVMVIIYLILRYRRKRKMNKKSLYTKLLNQ
ncbi:PIR protein, putative [Plasmodium sp. gorilla clade G1]|nr:PIR protein, putative [Plasmodium sp. gorilla clade G1]